MYHSQLHPDPQIATVISNMSNTWCQSWLHPYTQPLNTLNPQPSTLNPERSTSQLTHPARRSSRSFPRTGAPSYRRSSPAVPPVPPRVPSVTQAWRHGCGAGGPPPQPPRPPRSRTRAGPAGRLPFTPRGVGLRATAFGGCIWHSKGVAREAAKLRRLAQRAMCCR
eukprot:358706-Chlamydomonas_euryale.AAC.2